jgi:hypothetical protein
MTDLSTIDFSKLELPMWNGLVLLAIKRADGVHIRDGLESVKERNGAIVCRDEVGVWWVTRQCPQASFSQLDDLKAICAKVDAFIAAEQKRLIEAALPPWRDCGLEEAEEWSWYYDNVREPWWRPMIERLGNEAPECYRYRTRVLKKDEMSVKMTTGQVIDWLRDNVGIELENVHQDKWRINIKTFELEQQPRGKAHWSRASIYYMSMFEFFDPTVKKKSTVKDHTDACSYDDGMWGLCGS